MKNFKQALKYGAFAAPLAIANGASAFVVDTTALTTELADVATNVGAIFGVVIVAVLAVIGAKLGLRLIKSMATKAV